MRAKPKCEPAALAEALVAIVSGVILWMGLWDLIEECVPAVWYAKFLMVVGGGTGLLCTRQLYDDQQAARPQPYQLQPFGKLCSVG